MRLLPMIYLGGATHSNLLSVDRGRLPAPSWALCQGVLRLLSEYGVGQTEHDVRCSGYCDERMPALVLVWRDRPFSDVLVFLVGMRRVVLNSSNVRSDSYVNYGDNYYGDHGEPPREGKEQSNC